jgi:hypothetical protein
MPLADEERSFVFVSEGYYTPGHGNTYYVDTWDGTSWVERTTLYQGPEGFGPFPDVIVTADLSAYLPDPDGEYKIRLRNSMSATWIEAYVDWVSMSINFADYNLVYAQEFDTTDILSQVKVSDDVKWDAVNKWAVFKFIPYTVQFEDFAKFARQWLREDCAWSNNWCEGADLNHVDGVSTIDLMLLADKWLSVRPDDWPLK